MRGAREYLPPRGVFLRDARLAPTQPAASCMLKVRIQPCAASFEPASRQLRVRARTSRQLLNCQPTNERVHSRSNEVCRPGGRNRCGCLEAAVGPQHRASSRRRDACEPGWLKGPGRTCAVGWSAACTAVARIVRAPSTHACNVRARACACMCVLAERTHGDRCCWPAPACSRHCRLLLASGADAAG